MEKAFNFLASVLTIFLLQGGNKFSRGSYTSCGAKYCGRIHTRSQVFVGV